MKKYFVMSDIHSFYDEMIAALDLKGFDEENPNHILVVCGDLFDRGPAAVKVYEYVKELANQDRFIYIRGNHEDLLFQCYNDILKRNVQPYHISNGTIDTICQFTGLTKYDLGAPWCNMIPLRAKLEPVLNFITDKTVDYAILGDYICVHGWIPCESKDANIYHGSKRFDKVSDDIFREGLFENIERWRAARWINGMLAWHQGMRIEGKTIICGHWHTSWGHSHLHRDRKEFPQKNRIDWQKSFEIFKDEGIVALDACTAYSGFCNCWVMEI